MLFCSFGQVFGSGEIEGPADVLIPASSLGWTSPDEEFVDYQQKVTQSSNKFVISFSDNVLIFVSVELETTLSRKWLDTMTLLPKSFTCDPVKCSRRIEHLKDSYFLI